MPDAGDGSNRAANQITHPGSGGGGLNNTGAWVRMQDPAGVRECIFNRPNATTTTWTCVYSKAAKFVVGGSAAVRPTAADELVFVSLTVGFHPTANSRHHCWASDVAPYPLYLFSYPVGGGTVNSFLMMDAITQIDSTILDPDPVYWMRGYANGLNDLCAGNVATSNTGLSAWGWTTAGVLLNVAVYCAYTNIANFGGFQQQAMPPIVGASNDLTAPGLAHRLISRSDPGTKGLTTHCRFGGTTRASGDTYNITGTRDRIYLLFSAGSIILPWNGDVVLV